MGLTAPYAIKVDAMTFLINLNFLVQLARSLSPYNLKWMEEFLPPDDYAGYAQVHQALAGSVLLTTGEHEYTRRVHLNK